MRLKPWLLLAGSLLCAQSARAFDARNCLAIPGTVVGASGTACYWLSINPDGSINTAPSANTDYRPAPANITARDIGSTSAAGQDSTSLITSTPTAASFQAWAIDGDASIGILVSGTWTGTLQFEVSYDGGTTWTPTALRVRGMSTTQSAITANGFFSGDVASATNFRIRATAAWTGTATVQPAFSPAPSGLHVLNPVRLFDNASGAVATIKPASTPPAATDTTLVVGLNPGAPLPAGTALLGKVGIDQTTPGTTNAVAATNFPSTVSTGTGAQGASSPRVTVATDSATVAGSSSLPAGTNVIGHAIIDPATSGGTSAYSGNITTAGAGAGVGGVAIDTSPGQLYGYAIYNNNATVCYIQLLDQTQALANLGTTAPKNSIGIPANGGANVAFPFGIPFATAITAGVTTTRAGSTACGNGLDINLWYK